MSSVPAATTTASPRHIRLTSHSGGFGALPIHWAAPTPAERGPIVGTTTTRAHRNVIGTHSGSYSVYRALAVAAEVQQVRRTHRVTKRLPTALQLPDGPGFGVEVSLAQLNRFDRARQGQAPVHVDMAPTTPTVA